SKMSGLVGGTILQQAKSSQTVKMLADQQLEEAGIKQAHLDLDRDSLTFAPTWSQAMAKAGQNVKKALTYVETDPTIKKKYPNASSLVANIYGGQKNVDGVIDHQVTEQQKAEELRQKEQSKGDYQGDPNAQTPAAFLSSLAPNEQETIK